jgi:glycosyltransferase involved in cell wall biosynthesis
MGLVALEAQACGLPVLYQPVPGLTESLANSALPTDLSDAPSLAHALTRLRASPNHQKELRQAGLRNAARYPLSATATELIALGKQIS